MNLNILSGPSLSLIWHVVNSEHLIPVFLRYVMSQSDPCLNLMGEGLARDPTTLAVDFVDVGGINC